MKYVVTLFAASLLFACGDGKKDAAEEIAATSSTGTGIDLSSYDMPLTVTMPDKAVLGADTPAVRWNEEFGQLELSAGDHFGIIVTEEPADLARLKADLDRDMLRKHTIILDGADRLVYRSQFPDESIVFVHFTRVVTSAGRSFLVQDDPNGKFNETEIDRMLGAITAKEAL